MSSPVGRLRRVVGVDVGAALNLVGALLKYFSLAFLFPIAIALGHSETPWPFVAGGAITAAVGLGLERFSQGKEHVGVREGFLVVSLTWLLAAGAVSLPYVFSGESQLDHPVDALFEAMSGMTTSGGEHPHRLRRGRPLDDDLAAVQPVDRRNGHRRPRAGRPAAPAGRRPPAHGARDARARPRPPDDLHPGHRAPALDPLRLA